MICRNDSSIYPFPSQSAPRPTYTVTSSPLLLQPALNVLTLGIPVAQSLVSALEIWFYQFYYNSSLSALTEIPSAARLWNFFYSFLDWILSLISSVPTVNPSCMAVTFFLLKWGRSCLFRADLLCACVTVLPVLAHPHALPTLLTFASLPTCTIIFVPTCLLHLCILPRHLYSCSDPSQAHSLCVDSLCSQDRTFFPPPHMPFLSPYFRISASLWFILHIAFIFFHLIPHFPSPPPSTGIQNFLLAIKHDFRCWTLN